VVQPSHGITFSLNAAWHNYPIHQDNCQVGVLYEPEHGKDEDRYFAALSQGQFSESVELLAISTYCGDEDSEFDYGLDMCSVLWIGWDGDIAYRRALGAIRKDVWESWRPKTITVTLG